MRADETRRQRGNGQHQRECQPHQRLHEAERPAPQGVLDLEPQDRVAGHPRHPGREPEQHAQQRRQHHVADQRDADQHDAGRHQRQPEQPPPRHAPQRPRPPPHAGAEPGEHRPEQHAVAGVVRPEVVDVDTGQRDHHTAGGERAHDPEHESPHQLRPRDVRPAVDDAAEHPDPVLLGDRRPRGDRAAQPEQHHPGHGERRRDDVQRQVDRRPAEPTERRVQRLSEDAQPDEHRGRRQRGTVRRREDDLVGRLQPLARHQVGHRRVLGRAATPG